MKIETVNTLSGYTEVNLENGITLEINGDVLVGIRTRLRDFDVTTGDLGELILDGWNTREVFQHPNKC